MWLGGGGASVSKKQLRRAVRIILASAADNRRFILWFNPKCRVFRGSQEALAHCRGRPTPACGLETRAPGHSRPVCAGLLKSFMELLFSHQVLSDSATPWAVARQAPRSVGFPRQEDWSGLPFPSPGDLPHPGMGPTCPALAGRFFTAAPPGKPQILDPHRLIVTIFPTFFRDASLLLQRLAALQCLHREPERPGPQPLASSPDWEQRAAAAPGVGRGWGQEEPAWFRCS